MAEGAASEKELMAETQADNCCNQGADSPGPAATLNAPNCTKTQGARPVIDGGMLKVDERLRVARERREEQERQQAARDSLILERERKAQLQYEQQKEERQKRLDEQRRKEEQRRAAVEEKRRQKLEEEKEHYEAVLRRTLERSQRLEQRQKRWSWGGGLTGDTGHRSGDSEPASSAVVARVANPSHPDGPQETQQVDKRSTSTMNLKQHAESGISKRLSNSTAALLHSPDKSAKRRSSSLNRLLSNGSQSAKEVHKPPQGKSSGPTVRRSSSLTRTGSPSQPPPKADKAPKNEAERRPVDGWILSRLLTPTQASLARSKSAAALSADREDCTESLCPRSSAASPSHPPRGPMRSRSIDRQKAPSSSASSDGQGDSMPKAARFSSPAGRRRPSPSPSPSGRRSPSPAQTRHSSSGRRSPSPVSSSPRHRPPSPNNSRQHTPSVQPISKPPPAQRPALTPTGPPILRKRDPKAKEASPLQPFAPKVPEHSEGSATSSMASECSSKATAGTTSAEEAAKILAEKRRLVREQKEREMQERLQLEEEERKRQEEEARREEEERVKRLAEEQQREEERRREEERVAQEQQEEKDRQELEEKERQAVLQKEREEAEARALVEAEKQRQEREKVMQQSQQERMERKRRIEEIMKRTRKTDQNDDTREENSQAQANGDVSDESTTAPEHLRNGCNLANNLEGELQEGAELEGTTENSEVEMENKENEVTFSEGPALVSLAPKDSALMNGKSSGWGFEEFIDLSMGDGPNPGWREAAGEIHTNRVAFEDMPLHQGQPMEALSEM